ncbi:MAG: hypothetical protein V2B17_03160 [Chloroflexota bacterium]
MNDAVGLLASVIALILVPVGLARLVLGRADLAALYRAPGDDGWARGVQEGDCPRWRLDRARLTEPTGRVMPPQLHGDAAAELLACNVDDVAALDPAAGRLARGHVVQPRAAVHGRVGLAGSAEPRTRARRHPRASERAFAPDHA